MTVGPTIFENKNDFVTSGVPQSGSFETFDDSSCRTVPIDSTGWPGRVCGAAGWRAGAKITIPANMSLLSTSKGPASTNRTVSTGPSRYGVACRLTSAAGNARLSIGRLERERGINFRLTRLLKPRRNYGVCVRKDRRRKKTTAQSFGTSLRAGKWTTDRDSEKPGPLIVRDGVSI